MFSKTLQSSFQENSLRMIIYIPQKTQEHSGNSDAQLQLPEVLRQIGDAGDQHIGNGQREQIVHAGDRLPLAVHELNGQDESGIGDGHGDQSQQDAQHQIQME